MPEESDGQVGMVPEQRGRLPELQVDPMHVLLSQAHERNRARRRAAWHYWGVILACSIGGGLAGGVVGRIIVSAITGWLGW